MPVLQDDPVWQQRRDALIALLDQWTTPDPGLPRPPEGLRNLALRLKSFALQHFDFFHAHYGDALLTARDATALPAFEDMLRKHPRDYALSVILDQVAYDLEVIQRAADQRSAVPVAITTTLEQADKLAFLALEPAKRAGLVEKSTTVVTYFEKSPRVRVVPYAPLAVIGLPLTCTSLRRDYLAIPHEIGHYVYWHGRIEGAGPEYVWERFEQDVPPHPTYRSKWKEEIFADTYGCLCGGPVMALDFQDLMLKYTAHDFVRDDGEHPSPVLRPELYLEVLQRMSCPNATARLRARWDERLSALKLAREFRRPYSAPVACDEALDATRSVVDLGIDLLGLDSFGDTWGAADLGPGDRLKALYDRFDRSFDALLGAGGQPVALAAGPDLWTDWANRFFAGPVPDAREIDPAMWHRLLRADGWVTRGPSGHWRK
jgi:hypothetical protein